MKIKNHRDAVTRALDLVLDKAEFKDNTEVFLFLDYIFSINVHQFLNTQTARDISDYINNSTTVRQETVFGFLWMIGEELEAEIDGLNATRDKDNRISAIRTGRGLVPPNTATGSFLPDGVTAGLSVGISDDAIEENTWFLLSYYLRVI